MMYVKDFLMNLTTRENWTENAKACLDQIMMLKLAFFVTCYESLREPELHI
jgi:hypothetical protein